MADQQVRWYMTPEVDPETKALIAADRESVGRYADAVAQERGYESAAAWADELMAQWEAGQAADTAPAWHADQGDGDEGGDDDASDGM